MLLNDTFEVLDVTVMFASGVYVVVGNLFSHFFGQLSL